MVIYGEYLFLENFIAGGLLIFLTGRLLGESMRWPRVLLACSGCGAAGFLVLVPAGILSGLLLRILCSLLMPYLAFGAERIGQLVKKGILFLSLTMLSGGAVMALLLWCRIPALSGNGSIYIEAASYLEILCWSVPAFTLCGAFIRMMHICRIARWTEGELKICLREGGLLFSLHAAVDTGNCLREPITGSPVILIDRKGKKKLGIDGGVEASALKDRFTVIPYQAVGTACGILEGIRTTEVSFCGKKIPKAVLAFYDGDFGQTEALVNREVINHDILETHAESA